jgi:hypothetical protein
MGCNSRNRRNSYHCPDHGIGRLIWLNTRYDERGLCADCRDILTTAQWKHGMASVFDETGSYSRRCGCQWRAGRSVGAYVCSPVFKPQFCHKGLRPATICGFGPPLCWSEQGSNPGSRVRERDGEDSGIRARAMNGGDAVANSGTIPSAQIHTVHSPGCAGSRLPCEGGCNPIGFNKHGHDFGYYLFSPSREPSAHGPRSVGQAGTHASTSTRV